MSEHLKLALDYLFENEGDTYVDNPDDSGGPTKWGVTQKMYSNFLGELVTSEKMEFLTKEDVGPFYEKMYWNPIHGDEIASCPIAIAIFDTSVLYGKVISVKMAQNSLEILGWRIAIDGAIGEQTLNFLNRSSLFRFLPAFKDQILKRINEVICLYPKNEVFRQGWTNRANRLLTELTNAKFNPV